MTLSVEAAPLTFEAVLEARERAAGQLPRTPTRASITLADRTSASAVWLKLENHHYAGSFKERGALNAILTLPPEQAEAGVVAASAGNHAQALAYHARRCGVSAKIVMPVGTPHVKVEGTRRFGAEIVLAGDVFDDSMAEARRIEAEEGRALIHAFDNPAVIAGQGTATLELLEDAPELDYLIVPVGGGGLIAGALLAVEGFTKKNGAGPKVIGVETEMYPSLRNELDMGGRKVGGGTIAEGIAIKSPGGAPLSIIRPRMKAEDVLLVEEAQIEEAVVALAMGEKSVAEGAGAAGVAALLQHSRRFADARVGVIVCGGNIDARLLGQVLARHLVRVRRRARVRVQCVDRPGRLAEITTILHAMNANVMDVMHDRLALDAPAKDTVIDLVIETDHESVMRDVIKRLQEAGFPRARLMD